ncbi:UNVERIFIED_CONTAM: hypothetical protein Scaly_2498500 [Sesamum calycinum]|uniref:Uncharacterized protein n=1 Tax=Sesamum calycinum TaxID=2727403 RepID=A0AAW2LS88_9LAMI
MRHELQKFGVNPPYMRLYRAKKIAMLRIKGNHIASFGMLTKYAEMVSGTNPRSIFKLQYAHEMEGIPPTPIFKRAFMALKALRDGFLEGCSPFIGFDGCHMKGPYGGVLLVVVALDENNELYPLAFVVVEVEYKQKGLVECIAEMVEFDENVPLEEAVKAVKRQRRSALVSEIPLESQKGPPLTQPSQVEANAQDGGLLIPTNMDPISVQIEVDAAPAAFFEDAHSQHANL